MRQYKERKKKKGLHPSLCVSKVVLQSHLSELLWVRPGVLGNQGFDGVLLVTLGGDLRNDFILAFAKAHFATNGSISAVDWADSADVVPHLTSLSSYHEMETELVLALQASEVSRV